MGTATKPKRPKEESVCQPETLNLDKAIILTPEQTAAVEAPNRQFIVGPAGTGKTIILQAKALEMLRDGKSVFVFCPPWYASKYKRLFDQNGFANYKIDSSWQALVEGTNVSGIIRTVRNLGQDAYRHVEDMLHNGNFSTQQNPRMKFLELLSSYDGLFIDDMTDRFAWS